MAEIAIALDVGTAAEALRIVDTVGAGVAWYKVNPVLYVSDGPALIAELQGRGKHVFLDLKWHDIPNTVAGAVEKAAAMRIDLATVHLTGGRRMLEAAARAKAGMKVVGVGVLTSHSTQEFAEVLGRPVGDVAREQERLMRIGLEAGLDGFVSAGNEAAMVRALAPKAFIVTPGIRRAQDATGDQSRTATPAEAVRAGADLLVIGRPITGAGDPAEAARQMRAEMQA